MKKTGFALIFSLLLVLSLFACTANAELYPEKNGYTVDLAGVLDNAMTADLNAMNERTRKAYGGAVYLLTRDFLGGADAQQYAENLFRQWELGEQDALLVLVIGEEKYALCVGDKLGKAMPHETRSACLADNLRDAYLSMRYTEALNRFIPAFCQKAATTNGKELSTIGVFGIRATAVPTNTPASAKDQFVQKKKNVTTSSDNDDDNGPGIKSIIIVLVVFWLLGRRKGGRHRSHRWR